ncbi:MAG: hypothetical protein U0990_04190 [Candidatus Nanopelagicales bacterium]|nr:hypothetical protein [Candidatus Nanopelagicales bacterium]
MVVKDEYIKAQGGKCDLDKADVDLVASLVGRTILVAEWRDDCKPGDSDWTGHEYALLTLDDGRTIVFGGTGHDAWGATVSLS